MLIDNRRSYMESDILEADGYRLVVLLYSATLESLDAARRHLAANNIKERSRAITKVAEILNELALAVDHEAGGELSRNLVELYDYLQVLLQKGNAEQFDPPLAEAQSLLETLFDAWKNTTAPGDGAASYAPATATIPPAGRAPVDCVG